VIKYKLQLTDTAFNDLDDIMDYIALDAPVRAETYVDKLLDKIRILKNMPKRCALAPESGRRGYKLRHLIHGKYRILFIVRKKEVFVLHVIHGARLLDPDC